MTLRSDQAVLGGDQLQFAHAGYSDATAPAPRLSDPASLASTRVRVLDRDGQVLFDAPGFNVDWMPPWP